MHPFTSLSHLRYKVMLITLSNVYDNLPTDELVLRDGKLFFIEVRAYVPAAEATRICEKFGIPPASIPDWLALVGDDADGIPGVPRWGARSAATVLAHYGHIEAIPDDASKWKVTVRGAPALAESLRQHRIPVALYKTLATLREDAPLPETLEDLRWRGADRDALTAFCAQIGDEEFVGRIERWRDS